MEKNSENDTLPIFDEGNEEKDNSNKNLKEKVASGMIWKFAERILAQGITFIVSLVLARILIPEDYGAVAMITVFISIADVIISSGFTVALIQKKDADDFDYSTVFYTNFMISMFLYLLLFILAPTIAKMYELPELSSLLRVIALKLPISAYNSVQTAYISRQLKFKAFFFSTLIGTIVSAFVGIIMAYNGYGAWSLVAQQLTNLVMDTLILAITIRWHPNTKFSIVKFKSMYGYGFKIMAADLTGTIFNQLNSFVIGLRYTSADLAFYTKGQNLPNMINNTITSSLTAVLFPAISKVSDNADSVKRAMRRSIKTMSYILMPMFLGMACVSKELVTVLYTEKWIDMVPYMQILCIDAAIGVIGAIDILVLKSIGKGKEILILELIKKPLFLVIILIAMNNGVLVLAIVVPVMSTIATILNSIYIKKYVNYGFFGKIFDCKFGIICSLIMCVIVYFIGMLPINTILLLVLEVFGGAIFYFLASITLKNEIFLSIVNIGKKKMKGLLKR